MSSGQHKHSTEPRSRRREKLLKLRYSVEPNNNLLLRNNNLLLLNNNLLLLNNNLLLQNKNLLLLNKELLGGEGGAVSLGD